MITAQYYGISPKGNVKAKKYEHLMVRTTDAEGDPIEGVTLTVVGRANGQIYYNGPALDLVEVNVPYYVEYTVAVSDYSEELKTPAPQHFLSSRPIREIDLVFAPPAPFINIVHTGSWVLQDDGRYKSNYVSSSGITKNRITFTSVEANRIMNFVIDSSSENGFDFILVGMLDNVGLTRTSNFTDRTSGNPSTKTVSVVVPTTGDHFIDIAYAKDGSGAVGSDCGWYKIIDPT